MAVALVCFAAAGGAAYSLQHFHQGSPSAAIRVVQPSTSLTLPSFRPQRSVPLTDEPSLPRAPTTQHAIALSQVPSGPARWPLAGAIALALSALAILVYQMTARMDPEARPVTERSGDGPWSNPNNEVLRRLAPGLWVAERPFVWNGIDVGGKMAVVRLRDGALWVHSPVALDAALKAAIDALGPVHHIVSPNFEHVKYAAQWIAAYPEATAYGCPGAVQKFSHIPYNVEVGADNSVPSPWVEDLAVTFIDAEHNPFTGKPFFNEVVFLHRPTGTLIVTDLFWNYPAAVPPATRLWKFGMDQVYLPFYERLMIRDRSRFEAAMGRIVGWDFDAVLPCHGVYLPCGGKQAFQRHLHLPTAAMGAVGQPGQPSTVGGVVARTIEALEYKRIEAQSVQDADGWKGEPKAWAEPDSPTQRLSSLSQVGVFAQAKLWLARELAGMYDAEAVAREMQALEAGTPVVMYSFSSCPFCLKAKGVLDDLRVPYCVMELDVVPNGKAIRAEL
eukprot:EG_transcript_9661